MTAKISAITNTNEAHIEEETKQDLLNKAEKMTKARDEKIVDAISHLMEQLDVTKDKYLTATGVMAAMHTMSDSGLFSGDMMKLSAAKEAAFDTAIVCGALYINVKSIKTNYYEVPNSVELLKAVLDDVYDKDYASGDDNSNLGFVKEMMILSLCQQVGPSLQDIADFYEGANKDIEETLAKAEEMDD